MEDVDFKLQVTKDIAEIKGDVKVVRQISEGRVNVLEERITINRRLIFILIGGLLLTIVRSLL